MRILMIHGRSQGGKSEQELKDAWTSALKSGYSQAGLMFPKNIEIDLPFYGDELDKMTAKAGLPDADVIAKGPGKNPEFEQFMQQVLGEMRKTPVISKAVDQEITDTAEKGITNWGITQAIIRALDRHLTGFSDFTIELFLKDVFLYINNQNVTNTINNIVASKMTNEPTLVVAHSLGSVVAYKILTDGKYPLNLLGLVTVGSPLGIIAINSKLGKVSNPADKAGWFNAYDERDVVALNPLDDRYFPVDPDVVNNNAVSNHTHNRHGISGYLDDARVVNEINRKLA